MGPPSPVHNQDTQWTWAPQLSNKGGPESSSQMLISRQVALLVLSNLRVAERDGTCLWLQHFSYKLQAQAMYFLNRKGITTSNLFYWVQEP